MSSVSPTHQDLSNYATFSQIKSRVPVPLNMTFKQHFEVFKLAPIWEYEHPLIWASDFRTVIFYYCDTFRI